MKIRIEIDETIKEDEVVIRTASPGESARRLKQAVEAAAETVQEMAVYKDGGVHYLPLSEILFFETEGNAVYAHTRSDMFTSKHRLYELELLLPHTFMRVSKSAVLNLAAVCSVTRSFPSACMVQLQGTHKQVYVSRNYDKLLRERLEEKRELK